MNKIRNTILTNIRKSIGREKLELNTIKKLEERLITHPVHEQPVLGKNLISIFIKQLEKVAGTLELIHSAPEIPNAVLKFLFKHNLPPKIVLDTWLSTLPWPQKLQIVYRAAIGSDLVSVNSAFAGIAETGSLVLLSSPASPTTLNFLPENHIVVLLKDNLVAHIEDVFPRLRMSPMSRTINIITGPSRTADIEQTIQLGAHGPRRLHVIWVDRYGHNSN